MSFHSIGINEKLLVIFNGFQIPTYHTMGPRYRIIIYYFVILTFVLIDVFPKILSNAVNKNFVCLLQWPSKSNDTVKFWFQSKVSCNFWQRFLHHWIKYCYRKIALKPDFIDHDRKHKILTYIIEQNFGASYHIPH